MLKLKDVKPGNILYCEAMYGRASQILVLSKPVKLSGHGRYRMDIMWLSKTNWGNVVERYVVERYIAFDGLGWSKLC